MQGSSKLGFGMMRLPQLSGEATDIDFAQVNRMVDRFLEAGFTLIGCDRLDEDVKVS